MIRSVGITRLAVIGATAALLWLSPAAAGDQTLPWVPMDSVVAIAKRLNSTVAPAALDFDALRKVVQIYASRELPPARSSVDNARNGFQAGSSDLSSVFESERRLRTVQLDLLRLKVELQTKNVEMERLGGGSL